MVFWKQRGGHDDDDNNNNNNNDELQSFATGELEYEPPCDHATQEQEEEQQEDIHDSSNSWNPVSIHPNVRLMLAFMALVITGTANTVFTKLQAVPLYNYPNFVNLFGCIVFIPLTFAYIIPAAHYGWFQNSIPRDQLWTLSQKTPFLIMGALDCMACIMQTFAAVYLPGPLLVLLPQAAIPMSMMVSRHVLGTRYQLCQYVGAIVVIFGIMVVLEPQLLSHRNSHVPTYVCQAAIDLQRDCAICQWETTEHSCLSHRLDIKPSGPTINESVTPPMIDNQATFVINFEHYVSGKFLTTATPTSPLTAYGIPSNDDDVSGRICEWVHSDDSTNTTGERWLILVWSGILLLSTIPMTISTTYKEIVLQRDKMDPIFLNGWIVVFQTLYSLVLMFPAGIISSPSISPRDIPQNIYDGFQCYAFAQGTIEDGCHPDTDCANAALFFNIGLFCNALYLITCMYIIQWGSTSLLFLGLTVMVPLCNLVFCMPFMPYPATFHTSDIAGLMVIMTGLILYRFSQKSSSDDVDHNEQLPLALQPHLSAIALDAMTIAAVVPAPPTSTATSTTTAAVQNLKSVVLPVLEQHSMHEDQLHEPLLPRRTGDV